MSASIQSRADLKEEIFSRLGAPAHQINVNNQQVDSMINKALDFYTRYAFDGTKKDFIPVKINASTISFKKNLEYVENIKDFNDGGNNDMSKISGSIMNPEMNDFYIDRKIYARKSQTGKISEATITNDDKLSKVLPYYDDEGNPTRNTSGTLIVHNMDREADRSLLWQEFDTLYFTREEALAEENPFGTITHADIGVYDKRYVEVPPDVFGVISVLSISSQSNARNIFDLQYQLRLHDLYDLTSASMIYYTTVMQHLALIDFILNGEVRHRFNYREGIVYIDVNWDTDALIGEYIVLEGYRLTIDNQTRETLNVTDLLKAKELGIPTPDTSTTYDPMADINTLPDEFVGTDDFVYHKTYKVKQDGELETIDGVPVQEVVRKVYNVNENMSPRAWGDEVLVGLAKEYVKLQWGENLKKFSNMQLPGGIILDGQAIYDEAEAKILELEKQIKRDNARPLEFFIG